MGGLLGAIQNAVRHIITSTRQTVNSAAARKGGERERLKMRQTPPRIPLLPQGKADNRKRYKQLRREA
jgi:hypothetical protein